MIRINRYKYLYLLSDFISLSISIVIITMLGLTSLPFFAAADFDLKVPLLFITIVASFLFVFSSNNLYQVNTILAKSEHLSAIIKSLRYFVIMIVVLFLLFAFSLETAAILAAAVFVTLIITLFIIRVLLFGGIFTHLSRNGFGRRIIIYGNGKVSDDLLHQLSKENPLGLNILGFINEDNEIAENYASNKKILGSFEEIKQIVKHNKADEILIIPDKKNYEDIFGLISKCRKFKTNVKVISDLFRIIPQKVTTENYAGLYAVDVTKPEHSKAAIAFKFLFDFTLALAALIILSPLFLFIAILIKTTSKGPVFFIQPRVGKNGKLFRFYKFRSMYVQSEEDTVRKNKMLNFMRTDECGSGNNKVKCDCRITSFGKFLRKTSLDELPQLINVIKGEMSLVGPRPCLDYEFENYENWQKQRVSVSPGCTGLWQVYGRGSVSFNDSVLLDLHYINQMSPVLDLLLMLKTLPVMIRQKGGG